MPRRVRVAADPLEATDSPPSIRLAVNYSHAAAHLLRQGEVEIDLFKLPPWPDAVAEASRLTSVFVHFDFQAGQRGPDEPSLEAAETLLKATATPYVNAHLTPLHQDLEGSGEDPRDWIRHHAEASLRSLSHRFGRRRITLENVPWERRPDYPIHPLATDPALLSQIVTAGDCRFLLDLAHARFAAEEHGLPVRELIEAHPLDRLAELHVTGLGHDKDGRRRDHMPMREEDFELLDWALGRIADGAWARPWALALEYGGLGPIFQWRSHPEVLKRELRALANLLHRHGLRSA